MGMSKFYNRESELALLKKLSMNVATSQGRLSLLVGRRRVGKTALLLQAFQYSSSNQSSHQFLYFFITKTNEKALAEEFFAQIKTQLDINIFGQPDTLEDIITILLDYSKSAPVTVVIDEFQDIQKVNPAFFSQLQKHWDKKKNDSMMHLICCGSMYAMMTKLFQDSSEPLFGRADNRIHLKPLPVAYIKEIMVDNQQYSAENLLLWYCVSGGIPKYLEWLIDAGDQPWQSLISEHSLLTEEGKYRIWEDFGSDHLVYFSILSAIADGRTARGEIESYLGGSGIGVALEKLENTYEIIARSMPVTAKANFRGYKYQIVDPFLNFWFRFIYKNRSAVEIGNFDYIRTIIERDFSTYSGRWLEKLFTDILAQSGQFNQIGGYWGRGNKDEIDIVAINDAEKTLLIAEVKRDATRYSEAKLIEKSQVMLQKMNKNMSKKDYDIHYRCFSLDNMDDVLQEFLGC